MSYTLFTDGACKGNPGPGGWAFILLYPSGLEATFTGSEVKTTNNRMELMAVIEGLGFIPRGSEVKIVTDSKYCITVATSRNPKLKNADLVLHYHKLLSVVSATFEHVKGHNGHPYNERVDRLASNAATVKI